MGNVQLETFSFIFSLFEQHLVYCCMAVQPWK